MYFGDRYLSELGCVWAAALPSVFRFAAFRFSDWGPVVQYKWWGSRPRKWVLVSVRGQIGKFISWSNNFYFTKLLLCILRSWFLDSCVPRYFMLDENYWMWGLYESFEKFSRVILSLVLSVATKSQPWRRIWICYLLLRSSRCVFEVDEGVCVCFPVFSS